MEACLNDENVDIAIDEFFNDKYGEVGKQVRNLMENTEDLQRKIFYLNGYYFTEHGKIAPNLTVGFSYLMALSNKESI